MTAGCAFESLGISPRALSEALLAEAIEEAEQRCDGLARGLAAFDRRARRRVDWLRATASVRGATGWDPSATRTPDALEPFPSRRSAERGRPRWTLTPDRRRVGSDDRAALLSAIHGTTFGSRAARGRDYR